MLLLVVLGGAVVAVLLAGFLARPGSDDIEPGAPAASIDAATDETGNAEPTTVPEPTTAPERDTSPEASDELVSLTVSMRDVENQERSAAGTIAFEFNTVTGEVCYAVGAVEIAGPFRSHIHVGPVGEDGGIVVDLGPLSSGDSSCLDVLPIDTNSILADLEGHYAELHDLSEAWTIRAQMVEGIDSTDSATVAFDPGSEGAYLQIEGATVALVGPVPDKATADALIGLFTDMNAGITVVDTTTIVSDAPAPSGRIVLAAAEFAVDSSTMIDVTDDDVTALRSLLDLHPEWELTAVGRTDGSGTELDNLELSLDRANSIRELLGELGVTSEIRVQGAGSLGSRNRYVEIQLTPP